MTKKWRDIRRSTPADQVIGVRISGYVSREDDTPLDHDSFLDAFIDWVESQGWTFDGVTATADLMTDDPEEQSQGFQIGIGKGPKVEAYQPDKWGADKWGKGRLTEEPSIKLDALTAAIVEVGGRLSEQAPALYAEAIIESLKAKGYAIVSL